MNHRDFRAWYCNPLTYLFSQIIRGSGSLEKESHYLSGLFVASQRDCDAHNSIQGEIQV